MLMIINPDYFIKFVQKPAGIAMLRWDCDGDHRFHIREKSRNDQVLGVKLHGIFDRLDFRFHICFGAAVLFRYSQAAQHQERI